MATDNWPQEESAVFDAASRIIPMYPEAAITEGYFVCPGATTTAGRLQVTNVAADAIGDGCWVALHTATGAGAPERISVLIQGPWKAKMNNGSIGIAAGCYVMNSGATGIVSLTLAGCTARTVKSVDGVTGTSYILAHAWQRFNVVNDEGIIYLTCH